MKKNDEEGKNDDIEKISTDDNKATTNKEECKATFKVTYQPSAKDQREELYDLLNKATERKSKAVNELNDAAKMVTRANPSQQAAVQKGFLNKSSTTKAKKKNWVLSLWDKYLGPGSFVRQNIQGKNYFIFFGAIVLFHFKGKELALPPPV